MLTTEENNYVQSSNHYRTSYWILRHQALHPLDLAPFLLKIKMFSNTEARSQWHLENIGPDLLEE